MSAKGHVWTLRVGRRIFTSQAWSVQPCVRPLIAVHVTAGRNALGGLGLGQQHATLMLRPDAFARVPGMKDARMPNAGVSRVRHSSCPCSV